MPKIIKLLLIFVFVFSFSNMVFAKNFVDKIFEKSLPDKILERKYKIALFNDCEHVEKRKPTTAFILGVFPGGGSFYTRSPVLGVADFILWPVSFFWDAPLAYRRAKKINMQETVFYCELRKKNL